MYILECSDGSYYTGSTKDLERRLWEHQNMLGANYTKKRLPVKLVYHEEYSRIDEAFYREKQVQGWSRKKKEALIEGKPELLPKLAKKIFSKKGASIRFATQHPENVTRLLSSPDSSKRAKRNANNGASIRFATQRPENVTRLLSRPDSSGRIETTDENERFDTIASQSLSAQSEARLLSNSDPDKSE